MNSIYEYLKTNHYDELFNNSNAFLNYLQNLTVDQVYKLLCDFNKLLRPENSEDILANGMMAGDLVSPTSNIRKDIIKKCIDTIKTLSDNNLRAQLAYYSVLYLHMFTDGNGRTSRLVYGLLNGTLESEEWYFHHNNSHGNFSNHVDILDESIIISLANWNIDYITKPYKEKYPLLSNTITFRIWGGITHNNIDDYLSDEVKNQLSDDEKNDICTIMSDNYAYNTIAGVSMLHTCDCNGTLDEWIKRNQVRIENLKEEQNPDNEYEIMKRIMIFNYDESKDLLKKWTVTDWQNLIKFGNEAKLAEYSEICKIIKYNQVIESYRDTEIYETLKQYKMSSDKNNNSSIYDYEEDIKKILLEYNIKKYPYSDAMLSEENNDFGLLLNTLKKYETYAKKIKKVDGKNKVYPVGLTKKEKLNNYYSMMEQLVNYQIEFGITNDDIIKRYTADFIKTYKAYQESLIDGEMVPYYGSPMYMLGRAKTIKECLDNIPENKFDISTIVEFMDNFREKYYPNATCDTGDVYDVSDEFYADYEKMEVYYQDLLKIEEILAPIVNQYWQAYLTNPNDHDPKHFRYVMHNFSKDFVDPEKMNKVCCSLNTDEMVIAFHEKCGLIFDMNLESVETIAADDLGSFTTTKAEFIQNFCDCKQQLTNPDGLGYWYEYSKNSKLMMPEMVEKQTQAYNIEANGEILSYYNNLCYSEIFLNNKAKACGAFYADDCNRYEDIKAYADAHNLPLIKISLEEQRTLKGMPNNTL